MDLSFFIKGSIIHAVLFGTGDKLLICFHGFGEDAEKFRSLEPSLGSHYTVVSIDLPFHGKTRWQKDDIFYPDDLKKLINEILQTCGKKTFSLMGYSLGGKIVFAAIDQSVCDGNHLVALRHRQIAARTEAVLNIDEQQRFHQGQSLRFIAVQDAKHTEWIN